jgi:hypothetical protein
MLGDTRKMDHHRDKDDAAAYAEQTAQDAADEGRGQRKDNSRHPSTILAPAKISIMPNSRFSWAAGSLFARRAPKVAPIVLRTNEVDGDARDRRCRASRR